jgi:hypothetical protein
VIEYLIKDPQGNRNRLEIDDDMSWMIPYLMVAKRKGVPIWRIGQIKGYVIPEGKAEGQQAQIFINENGKKYTITMLKQKQVMGGDGRRQKVVAYQDIEDAYAFEDTLLTLAHELMHLVEWNHTADHLILTAKLFLAFARFAKKQGYEGYAD